MEVGKRLLFPAAVAESVAVGVVVGLPVLDVVPVAVAGPEVGVTVPVGVVVGPEVGVTVPVGVVVGLEVGVTVPVGVVV